MVDSLNNNPFSNLILSIEQLQKLDANKDGIISVGELIDGITWITGQDKVEGFENELYEKAVEAGLKSYKAETVIEFKESMDIVGDQFFQMWLDRNPDADKSMKDIVKNYIVTFKTDFINKQLAENPQGPWYLKQMTVDFEKELNALLGTISTQETPPSVPGPNKAPAAPSKKPPSETTEKPPITLEELADLAVKANENQYISNEEWAVLSESTHEYLFSLLKENKKIDTLIAEIFKGMDPDYESNPQYLLILQSLNTIKSTTDESVIEGELNKIQEALKNFIESCDRNNVANSLINANQLAPEIFAQETIDSVIDVWFESNFTAETTDFERTVYKSIAENAKTEFLESLKANGKLSTLTKEEIKTQFGEYLNAKYTQYQNTQDKLMSKAGDTDKATERLYRISGKSYRDYHINHKEHFALVKAGVDVIIAELLNGNTDIELLAQLNPEFKSSKEFEQLQDVITQLKMCSDEGDVKQLLSKARQIAASMIRNYNGRELVNAIDKTKPIEISDKTHQRTLSRSPIADDYDEGAIRTSYSSTNEEYSLNAIKNQARKDLNTYANQLRNQLRKELGTAYNDTAIRKYIQDAVNDTLNMFTQNIAVAKGPNAFDSISNNIGFVKIETPHSSRYAYNVTSLIDTFVANFNANAEEKEAAKKDDSLITYDKENVLENSRLANDYGTEKTIRSYSPSGARYDAKNKLSDISNQIRQSMRQEGSKIDFRTTDAILRAAMDETLNEYSFENCSYNVKEIVDMYLSKVDAYFSEVKR